MNNLKKKFHSLPKAIQAVIKVIITLAVLAIVVVAFLTMTIFPWIMGWLLIALFGYLIYTTVSAILK